VGGSADAPAGGARLLSRSRSTTEKEVTTPRYVVERVFPNGWAIPVGVEGRERCLAIVERNADEGVTWLHSYVSDDGTKAFCIYDAPTPEALRRTAARSGLPVDRITEIRVLDPYVYPSSDGDPEERLQKRNESSRKEET
jgi:Nickel responsive protein SCO4226-like